MEQATSSRQIYNGNIVNLHVDRVTLADGKSTIREVVEHRGAAAVVPITDAGEVILVRQYRYAVKAELLEIPAGTMEEEETPESCATRELEEETGYVCKELRKVVAFFTAPGYTTELIHVFVAKGLTRTQMRTEEDERIRLEVMPLAEALDKVRSGEIQDAKSICGLYRASELT